MDPDLALENVRKALSAYHASIEHPDENILDTLATRLRVLDDMAEALEALDQWMTGGGFPPRGWTKVDP